MMRPGSLDQCADRLAVGKVQSKHLDLLCRAAKPSPLLARMGGGDDLIALRRQQFGEIGTVLAQYPGNQGCLRVAFTHAAAPKHSSGCGGDRRIRLCAFAQTKTGRQKPGDSGTAPAEAPPLREATSNRPPPAWGRSTPGTPSTNTSPSRPTAAKHPRRAQASRDGP